MKKAILLSLAVAALGMTASAQDNPNRMLVHSATGAYTPYIVNNVEKLTFATVEGTVACDVSINSSSMTMVSVATTMSEACKSFKINVFPGVIARSFVNNPDACKSYLDAYNSPVYNENFTNGELTGMELEYGTEYAVVTQGYDAYGTACEGRAAYFYTPQAEIVGNPKVEATVTGSTTNTISFRFVANQDVSTYYYVIFEKGIFEQQYNSFAPMFGFTNPGQMIKMWGSAHPGNSTESYTYTNLDPNTEYELYIQPLDHADNFAEMVKVDCATDKVGGEGQSEVEITLGDYKLNEWDGQMLPSQYVTYTPNSDTWRYRFGVYLASQYDANRDALIEYLQSEPEQPTAYWWFYDALTTDYQINPNSEFVVIASGQNTNGEWGPVAEKRFTTPASVSGMPAAKPSTTIGKRVLAPASGQANRVPAAGGIRLVHAR